MKRHEDLAALILHWGDCFESLYKVQTCRDLNNV